MLVILFNLFYYYFFYILFFQEIKALHFRYIVLLVLARRKGLTLQGSHEEIKFCEQFNISWLFILKTSFSGYCLAGILGWTREYQGPVVQSVVSLTSSLRVISLTVLADSIYNILIFFAEKMWVAFALQKLLTFFQQKIPAYLRITR